MHFLCDFEWFSQFLASCGRAKLRSCSEARILLGWGESEKCIHGKRDPEVLHGIYFLLPHNDIKAVITKMGSHCMASIQNVNGSHMTIGLPLSLVRWLAEMIGLQINDANTPEKQLFILFLIV